MRLFAALRDTPIGRALIAYFTDLPRWTLLNIGFALALLPSIIAVLQREFALALVFSLPPILVMTWLMRLLSVTLDGRAPHWSLLSSDLHSYSIVLSVWGVFVMVGLVLLTPLRYLAVVPALLLLLVGPFVICISTQICVSTRQAWRNAFVMAVHYPVVSLGLFSLGGLATWCVSVSGGALILALPALWATITVYTVDELIRSLQEQEEEP
jgi:hypothetical protein